MDIQATNLVTAKQAAMVPYVVSSISALPRWKAGGISGKKLLFVGDSTTALAQVVGSYIAAAQLPGGALESVVVPNVAGTGAVGNPFGYGENGASLAAFLAAGSGNAYGDSLTYGVRAVIAQQADLIIISYGINDVRLGLTTQAQLVSLMVQATEMIRAGSPRSDIVWRTPLALASTDSGGYISPSTSGQTYTDILRGAYDSMIGRWENVVVLDTQRRISGATSLPQSGNPYLVDSLHPNGTAQISIANEITAMFGYREPFSAERARVVRATNYATDYSVYPRAVEDPGYYDLIASGALNNMATTYLRFKWPRYRATEIQAKDLIVIGNDAPLVATAAGSAYNDGTLEQATQISMTFPNVYTDTRPIAVYRHRYRHDINMQTYWDGRLSWPYRFRGTMGACGSGYMRIDGLPGELNTAVRSALVAADTLIVKGIAPLVLTGASFTVFGAGIQINLAGDHSAKGGLPFAVFGTHAFENGDKNAVMSTALPWLQIN